MTIQPMGEKDLLELMGLIKVFLTGFEQLYVGDDPEKVSRCRLCIFQLIHVPQHIMWNGSIHIGSQATVERAIGEFGHKIHSKKAPFANLANIIYEKQLIHTLLLYYPSIAPPTSPSSKASNDAATLHQEIRITRLERRSSLELTSQLQQVHTWLKVDASSEVNLCRWGKAYLPGGTTIRSRLSESQRPACRSSCYFEATVSNFIGQPTFGEALAFFQILDTQQLVVAYHPLVHMEQVLKRWRGVWSTDVQVLPISAIHSVVGVWSYHSNVYILRKHPGLALLSAEESGLVDGTQPGTDSDVVEDKE